MVSRSLRRVRQLMHAAPAVAFAVTLICPGTARAQTPAPTSSAACIAIVLPSVQGVEGSATDVGNAVRELFSSYLTGPTIKAMSLDARLPAQAVQEAKLKNCDSVLIASVTRKRGGNLKQALGHAAGVASWYVPYGGSTASAVARGVTVATAQTVWSLASTTKAKDEMQLEYRVVTSANAVQVPSKTEKAKAKSDGEDLLTPLVEKAATVVATAVAK